MVGLSWIYVLLCFPSRLKIKSNEDDFLRAHVLTLVATTGHWASQNGQKCMMTDCDDFASGKGVPSNYAMAPGGDAFKDNCGGSKNRYVSGWASL